VEIMSIDDVVWSPAGGNIKAPKAVIFRQPSPEEEKLMDELEDLLEQATTPQEAESILARWPDLLVMEGDL